MNDLGLARIVVVGVTGSGKTTFAATLARRLNIPHVELDSLYWLPGWRELPLDDFRRHVTQALSGDRWVVDGNYRRVRDLIWPRADTLVWLDYPLRTSLWRLFKRTLRRRMADENLWNSGNRESLIKHFLTGDSLFVWAIRTHRDQRATSPLALAEPAHKHLNVVHLRSAREAAVWLAGVPSRT